MQRPLLSGTRAALGICSPGPAPKAPSSPTLSPRNRLPHCPSCSAECSPPPPGCPPLSPGDDASPCSLPICLLGQVLGPFSPPVPRFPGNSPGPPQCTFCLFPCLSRPPDQGLFKDSNCVFSPHSLCLASVAPHGPSWGGCLPSVLVPCLWERAAWLLFLQNETQRPEGGQRVLCGGLGAAGLGCQSDHP